MDPADVEELARGIEECEGDGGCRATKVLRKLRENMSDADKVMKILNDIDPEGLIRIGAPKDEYESEAQILLHRVRVQPLTAQYVRDVWLVMFATGDRVLVSDLEALRARHKGPATTVRWVGDMPLRTEFQEIADRINQIFPQLPPSLQIGGRTMRKKKERP